MNNGNNLLIRKETTKVVYSDTKASTTPIKYEQCINVRHIPSYKGSRDTHILRLKRYHEDGKISYVIELWYDYNRPFYITRKMYRTHKQRKNRESIDKVDTYWSTQSDLLSNVKRVTRIRGAHSLWDIGEQFVYLYGTDTSASAIIKHEINVKLKESDILEPNTFTAFDTETDVFRGDGNTIEIATVASTKDKHATIVVNDWYNRAYNRELFKKLCEEHLEGWNIEVKVSKDPVDLIQQAVKRVNEYDNDYCGVWGIDFDISKIENTLDRYRVEPASIFHGLGNMVRPFFNFFRGKSVKVTITGKVTHLSPTQIWNVLKTTSVGEWVDSMVLTRIKRTGFPEIPGGYGVDNILKTFLNKSKLKLVKEYDVLGGLEWHLAMQEHKPTEYMIYALYDVIGMCELEMEDTDSSTNFLQDIITPLNEVKSVARINDDVFFFANAEDGYVNSQAILNKELIEREKLQYQTDGWIAICPSYLLVKKKLTNNYFKPVINTAINSISTFVTDVDLTSAYPSGVIASNMSLETTICEWFEEQPELAHVPVFHRRKIMMDRAVGVSGQHKLCTEFLSLPDWDRLKDICDTYLDNENN